jgi:hypothetical protein
MLRLLYAALALAAIAAAGGTVPSSQVPRRHAFTGTPAMVSNPERGFRHEIDGGCSPAGMSNASIEELRRFNLTVAQTYCYLSNDTQLAPAALRSMDAAFATLRRAGVKALWRFAYDRAMPGTHVYTEDTILGHIDQLAAPFAQHHDALYVLQAGFIGSWGEWHSSVTNLHANKTAVSNVVEAELFKLLPPDRKINVRVPVYKLSGVLRRPSGYGGLGTAGAPLTAHEQQRQRQRQRDEYVHGEPEDAASPLPSAPPGEGVCKLEGRVVCPAWRPTWGSNESTLCVKNNCCWTDSGGPDCYARQFLCPGGPCVPMVPSAAQSSAASPMDFGVLDAVGSKLNTAVARIGYDNVRRVKIKSLAVTVASLHVNVVARSLATCRVSSRRV